METFIQLTARDIIRRFGTNLRDVTVVFPNKRAGLFMNQQLADIAQRPMWAPRYRTISELFDSLSDFTRCDDIPAVCELYAIYKRLVPEAESLDRFYGWGEIMLADFDDIDKHLADAHKLFSNIQAIKGLEDNSFLSPQQEEALQHFFKDFSIEDNSRLKERFLSLWNRMDEIYTCFNETLRQKGMLYEGALYKDVITHLDERFARLQENGRMYIFVGFNVLNEVEKRLFGYLQEQGKALFYWDYDVMYVHDDSHFEAGEFIRRNLKEFPNALTDDCFDNFRQPRKIEFIAASSENAQARYIPQWLKAELTEKEQDTAVVLCNEALLQPVLHALPDGSEGGCKVNYANVTMGFPMTDTPVFGFINALLSLQIEGYDPDRKRFRAEQEKVVRNHPYFTKTIETDIFTPCHGNAELLAYLRRLIEQLAGRFGEEQNPDVFKQMYNEALYRAHTIVCRFIRMTEEGVLDILPVTLRHLMRGVLARTTIPFHGEPATGLQIMGVLETRNLNFRHILMLSVNEGMLPKSVSDTSFIPYNLREVFGLTTTRHKIAVYAFYFYRLLQRTEHITYLYNTANDGLNKNEMSRFLRQLLAETDLEITTKVLQAGQAVPVTPPLTAEKTGRVMDILRNNYRSGRNGARPLSPSALNCYMECPLKFYYQQIAHIRKPDEAQDGLDSPLFGTIFHEAAELIYKHLTEREKLVRREDIERILERGEAGIMPFVDRSFAKNYFEKRNEEVFYNGQLFVARKVIDSYLRQLLTHDSRMGSFILVDMEQEYKRDITITSGDEPLTLSIGGKIDRMDTVMIKDENGTPTETLRVVDYKTGGTPESATSMEQLTTPSEKRAHYTFQTFLYAWVMSGLQKRPVSPALFYVHRSHDEDYDPTVCFNKVPVTDFSPYREEFESQLVQVLTELFDPTIPFTQTEVQKSCQYCEYKGLCGR